jgi:predicted transcriptional regulator
VNDTATNKKRPKVKPELSVFADELNVRFNPDEFLPDLPAQAKGSKRNETLFPPGPSGQTDNKEVTNGEQTDNKEAFKRITNRGQTGNKSVRIESANKDEIEKRVTERVTSKRVNRVQTDNKQVTKHSFEQLRGLEAKLLQFIFNECKTSGGLLTPPVTLERIAENLESTKGTAKTVIFRLTKKEIVVRENSATGRGGYTRFRIEKELYHALLIRESGNKQITNRELTDNKEVTQRVTERVTTPSSSSSSLDLDLSKLTNTAPPDFSNDLPHEWNEIDFNALNEIRFGRPQLLQLARVGNLTKVQLQESIHAFAFDLEVNGKAKEINGHPLNYFMGILRRGPYAPPSNYEAPDVRQMRLYLEARKREQQVRADLEAELETVEFDSWLASLSSEERSILVPPTDFSKPGSPGHNVQLKQYFRERIWPEVRATVAGGAKE